MRLRWRSVRKGRVRSRECACPKAAAFLEITRQTARTSCLAKALNKFVPPAYGRASCVRFSSAGALHHHQLRGGPLSSVHKSPPLSLFCGGLLRPACCYSDSQGVTAVCARSTITRARARGARRSGPHKCRPRSSEACYRAQPRQVGCGPHVTESTVQAASWASWSLTWDSVSGALYASVAFSRCLLRPPACRGMQPV